MREDAQRSAISLPFTPLRERNNPIPAMAWLLQRHGIPCAGRLPVASRCPV